MREFNALLSHLLFLSPTLQSLFSFCWSFLASSAFLLPVILTSLSGSLLCSLLLFFFFHALMVAVSRESKFYKTAPSGPCCSPSAQRDHGQPAILDSAFLVSKESDSIQLLGLVFFFSFFFKFFWEDDTIMI